MGLIFYLTVRARCLFMCVTLCRRFELDQYIAMHEAWLSKLTSLCMLYFLCNSEITLLCGCLLVLHEIMLFLGNAIFTLSFVQRGDLHAIKHKHPTFRTILHRRKDTSWLNGWSCLKKNVHTQLGCCPSGYVF